MKKGKKLRKETVEETSSQKLKEGQIVLYMTQYTLDKCTVVNVDKKNDLAVLSNQIKLSRSISITGKLELKNPGSSNATIRLWSPEVEAEYNYQSAIRSIPSLVRTIEKMSKEMGKEDVVTLHKKLNKIINKYE